MPEAVLLRTNWCMRQVLVTTCAYHATKCLKIVHLAAVILFQAIGNAMPASTAMAWIAFGTAAISPAPHLGTNACLVMQLHAWIAAQKVLSQPMANVFRAILTTPTAYFATAKLVWDAVLENSTTLKPRPVLSAPNLTPIAEAAMRMVAYCVDRV